MNSAPRLRFAGASDRLVHDDANQHVEASRRAETLIPRLCKQIRLLHARPRPRFVLEDAARDAKLSTWLVRIVVNEAIGRARKRSRGDRNHSTGQRNAGGQPSREGNMDKTSPEQPEGAAQRAQTRRLLEAKIDELPDTFRTVFRAARAGGTLRRGVRRRARHPGGDGALALLSRAGPAARALSKEIDLAYGDAFAFAGARCDRHRRGVMAKLEKTKI